MSQGKGAFGAWANPPPKVYPIQSRLNGLGTGQSIGNRHGMDKDIRLGIWNIKTLSGKEIELVGEIKKYKIDIIGLSETKKKGNGITRLANGFTMIYSGVNMRERAKGGVALAMKEELFDQMESWEAVSPRIIIANIQLAVGKASIIQVYAPTEDASMDDKDHFYEDMQRSVDKARTENKMVVICGDLNARTGQDNTNAHGVLGLWGGEEVLNDNGQRLIEFCIENDMLIGNSHFNHKLIHKITFQAEGREAKSIIDYIIYDRGMRRYFTDVKAITGAELGTDHRLVVADTRIIKPRKKQSKTYERIAAEKLRDPEVVKCYREVLQTKLQEVNYDMTLDDLWLHSKTAILSSANEACGIKKIKPQTKNTRWWNDQVQNAVKDKKEAWSQYRRNKSQACWEEYVRLRNRAKQIVREAKARSWEEFGREIQGNFEENQRKFWSTISGLRGRKGKQVRSVQDNNGNLVTNEKEVLKVWQKHYQTTFSLHEYRQYPRHDGRRRPRIRENQADSDENDGDIIEEDEVVMAIEKMKLGKAAGRDGIVPEFIKYGGEEMVKCLQNLFQKIWSQKKIPQDWENNIIIPIFKKGCQTKCENYRPICLSSVVYKLYTRILEQRLRRLVEHDLEEEQAGFRPGRQTQDHIFSLRMAVEKAWDRGRRLFLAFLDLKAAFDSIPRQEIWNALQEKRVPSDLISAIKSVYQDPKGIVRLNGSESEPFRFYKGVKQGDSLSPLLFIVCMDEVWKVCKRRTPRTTVGYWNLIPVQAQALLYADDVVLIADTREKLQAAVDEWSEELLRKGMEINATKSKVMLVGREDEDHPLITCNGVPLEKVDTYQYLGTIFCRDGRIDQEVLNRVKKANGVFYSICTTIIGKQEIKKETKIVLFKTIFLPVLMYGAESWTVLDKHVSKITAVEMRYLRRVLGKTRRDRWRNERVREELKVRPVKQVLEERQLKWFGHVCRMGDDRKAKWCMEARPEGRRPRGRPRLMYLDYMERLGRARGNTMVDMRRMASDRDRWTKWAEAVPPR